MIIKIEPLNIPQGRVLHPSYLPTLHHGRHGITSSNWAYVAFLGHGIDSYRSLAPYGAHKHSADLGILLQAYLTRSQCLKDEFTI